MRSSLIQATDPSNEVDPMETPLEILGYTADAYEGLMDYTISSADRALDPIAANVANITMKGPVYAVQFASDLHTFKNDDYNVAKASVATTLKLLVHSQLHWNVGIIAGVLNRFGEVMASSQQKFDEKILAEYVRLGDPFNPVAMQILRPSHILNKICLDPHMTTIVLGTGKDVLDTIDKGINSLTRYLFEQIKPNKPVIQNIKSTANVSEQLQPKAYPNAFLLYLAYIQAQAQMEISQQYQKTTPVILNTKLPMRKIPPFSKFSPKVMLPVLTPPDLPNPGMPHSPGDYGSFNLHNYTRDGHFEWNVLLNSSMIIDHPVASLFMVGGKLLLNQFRWLLKSQETKSEYYLNSSYSSLQDTVNGMRMSFTGMEDALRGMFGSTRDESTTMRAKEYLVSLEKYAEHHPDDPRCSAIIKLVRFAVNNNSCKLILDATKMSSLFDAKLHELSEQFYQEYKAGHEEEAEAIQSKVIKLFPNEVSTHVLNAQLSYMKKTPKDSLTHLSTAINQTSNNLQQLETELSRVEQHLLNPSIYEANKESLLEYKRSILEGLYSRENQQATLIQHRIDFCLHVADSSKDHKERDEFISTAKTLAEAGYSEYPSSITKNQNMRRVSLAEKDYSSAITFQKNIVKLSQQNIGERVYLAVLYNDANQTSKSAQCFSGLLQEELSKQIVLDDTQRHLAHRIILKDLMQSKKTNTPEALKHAKASYISPKRDENDAYLLGKVALANKYFKLGEEKLNEFIVARETNLKKLKDDEINFDDVYQLADAYTSLSPVKAIELYDQAATKAKGNEKFIISTKLGRAAALQRLHRFKEARHEYDAVSKINSDNKEAKEGLEHLDKIHTAQLWKFFGELILTGATILLSRELDNPNRSDKEKFVIGGALMFSVIAGSFVVSCIAERNLETLRMAFSDPEVGTRLGAGTVVRALLVANRIARSSNSSKNSLFRLGNKSVRFLMWTNLGLSTWGTNAVVNSVAWKTKISRLTSSANLTKIYAGLAAASIGFNAYEMWFCADGNLPTNVYYHLAKNITLGGTMVGSMIVITPQPVLDKLPSPQDINPVIMAGFVIAATALVIVKTLADTEEARLSKALCLLKEKEHSIESITESQTLLQNYLKNQPGHAIAQYALFATYKYQLFKELQKYDLNKGVERIEQVLFEFKENHTEGKTDRDIAYYETMLESAQLVGSDNQTEQALKLIEDFEVKHGDDARSFNHKMTLQMRGLLQKKGYSTLREALSEGKKKHAQLDPETLEYRENGDTVRLEMMVDVHEFSENKEYDEGIQHIQEYQKKYGETEETRSWIKSLETAKTSHLVANCLDEQDYQNAEQILNNHLDTYPEDDKAIEQLSIVVCLHALHEGDYDRLEAECNSRVNPNDKTAMRFRARMHLRKEEFTKAEEDIRKLLSLDEHDADAHLQLSVLMQIKNCYHSAFDHCRTAISIHEVKEVDDERQAHLKTLAEEQLSHLYQSVGLIWKGAITSTLVSSTIRIAADHVIEKNGRLSACQRQRLLPVPMWSKFKSHDKYAENPNGEVVTQQLHFYGGLRLFDLSETSEDNSSQSPYYALLHAS